MNEKNPTQTTSNEAWLKKDLLKLTVINLVFLGAMLWLYKINHGTGKVDATIARWFGI
jgi:hypothetical protein